MDNPEPVLPDQDQELSDLVLDIIDTYSVGRHFQQKLEQSMKDEYGRLYHVAVMCKNMDHTSRVENFDIVTTKGEDAWMEKHYSDEPEAKKANGQWKARSFMPTAYSTAKAVVRNGLVYDCITDECIGKTALEKKYKEAKKAASTTTTVNGVLADLQSACKAIDAFERAVSSLSVLYTLPLDADEKAAYNAALRAAHDGAAKAFLLSEIS